MENKRSLKMFWQNQGRLVLVIFGGDLMPDIPHLDESDFSCFFTDIHHGYQSRLG